MKIQNGLKPSPLSTCERNLERRLSRLNPIWTAASVLALAIAFTFPTYAQEIKYSPLRVSSVAVQPSATGTSISITADGSLRRAQTWQDGDGYHVVVPYATSLDSVKPAKGVKVRRLGQSLEILIQAEPGTSVSSYVDDNRLRVSVSGDLEPRAEAAIDTSKTVVDENPWQTQSQNLTANASPKPSAADPTFTSQFSNQPSSPSTKAGPPSLQPRPDLRVSQTQGSEPGAPASEIEVHPEGGGFFNTVFSFTGVVVVCVLGVIGLLVVRQLRSRQSAPKKKAARFEPVGEESTPVDEPAPAMQVPPARRLPPKREAAPATSPRSTGSHLTVATPDSLYGAYRIDQEVGKLVLGQPHRMDVLSSRAPDDRRAIEASLIKMIASCSDENERRRAAEALEEYGFVARECAALLMATDPFDRTNAARSLGEMKSAAALPFLLEGLYDSESIVRNQAVASLGELKVPRAIGALLDMARRHPDVPGNLVSKALSACSVEGLDFFDAVPEPALLGDGRTQGFGFDIEKLEPAATVEDLPEASDDEILEPTLFAMNSEDIGERLEAAKTLARFPVQSAVAALTSAARMDSEANVRSQAISSLAAINHESVFPAVLIGMADESREVRAAAARSLTHLNFDRTDAFIRVLEMNDEELLPVVASACIKAGIVSQGIDRLASGDRRQAYETFSIVSVLARANQIEPVMEAIATHPNLDVRLATVRLLANTGEPEVFEQFRQLALQEGLAEELRTALLEAMYQLDRSSSPANSDELQQPLMEDQAFPEPTEVFGEIAFTEESPSFDSPSNEFEP